MKYVGICIALAVVVSTCGVSGQARAEANQPDAKSANQLFQAGKFAEAGEIYARIEAQNPNDRAAVLQLGRIALLANRLDDAQKWFEKAITLEPSDDDSKVMLAEAFYRRDDFQKSAAALDGVEVSTNKLIISQYPTLNVAKMESFKGQTPYDVQGEGQTTHLKFVNNTGPLPLVNVRVNGGGEVTFFIDTGGSEVALDTDFAKELGLPQFGAVQGTFAGGQHAEVQQSRIESLTVGDWTVKNLPAVTMPLRQLSAGLGVKRIDGIIGTTLFYHFLTTLDYPQGELVLRRKTAEAPKAVYGRVIRQRRRGPFLDGERPLHGGLGPCRDDATLSPLRRHGASGRGRQAGGIGYQGGGDQTRGRESVRRSGGWRKS